METELSGDFMSQGRIFADDWRDCLREQYKYVIRQQDSRTEVTLTKVLYDVGFSEDDLAALRLEATMRDMPDDYVPDEVRSITTGVDLPEVDPEPVIEATSSTLEEPVPVHVEDETLEEEPEEEIPVTFDELVEQEETLVAAEAEADEPEADDDEDSPQQMSLF
jgi:hypothetical protein